MRKLTIVMYHYVRDLKNSRYPRIKGLDYKLFHEQIMFFKAHYNIVRMEDVLEYCSGSEVKEKLPENPMLLTFDDGYIDHFTYVLPVLLEYGMQGSFFIPGKTFTENILLDVNKIHFILANADIKLLFGDLVKQLDYYRGNEWVIPSNEELFEKYAVASRFDHKETVFVKKVLQTVLPEKLRNIITSNLFEKYMGGLTETQLAKELYLNYEQIKCMKRNGMFIGSHGYDHYWLENLPKDLMITDINRALENLDGIIDTSNWVMNYPYGSYNEDTIAYLKTAGCRLGLTTHVRVADLDKDCKYELPRLDTNDFPPKSENYKTL